MIIIWKLWNNGREKIDFLGLENCRGWICDFEY